jgi:hypothetical protein
MRLKAQYAIRHKGDKIRWLKPNDFGSWDMKDEFTSDCLISKTYAMVLMKTPGLDHRYEMFRVNLDAKKIERATA